MNLETKPIEERCADKEFEKICSNLSDKELFILRAYLEKIKNDAFNVGYNFGIMNTKDTPND